MEWKNLYRGVLMGISDLIPGVSGGTIAVVLGIYDRLLEAISGFFSRDWKRHIGFLIPLAAGMGGAILLLSRVINYLLIHHNQPTKFFFLGLIIGVLPLLFKEADVKRSFKGSHIFVLIIAAVLVGSMAFFTPDKQGEPITELTLLTGIGLFASGWLASMAMLLPGISGSFVLLIIGVYPTAIYALSNLNLPLIMIIGAGVVLGFIISSKGIRYLMVHHAAMTYACIIGLVIGSIVVVFPGFWEGLGSTLVSLLTFLLGFIFVIFLGRQAR